jgi:amino acid adenylation domain-containing protein
MCCHFVTRPYEPWRSIDSAGAIAITIFRLHEVVSVARFSEVGSGMTPPAHAGGRSGIRTTARGACHLDFIRPRDSISCMGNRAAKKRFSHRTQNEFHGVRGPWMLTRDNIQDILPLSPLQEGMLFQAMRQEARGDAAYILQIRFALVGPLNLAAFHVSWDELVARHDALRTVFRASGADRPLQLILRVVPTSLTWVEIPHPTAEAVAELARNERLTGFDLATEPPTRLVCVRLTADRTDVIWTFHHIVLDGWCVGLLQRELAALYAARCEGRPPALPPAPGYGRFIGWLGQHAPADTLGYWQRALDGITGPPTLPGHRDQRTLAAGARTRMMRTHHLVLDVAVSAVLREHAAAAGTTIGVLLQTLWGILLGRLNDTDDVVFGSVAAIRPPALAGSDAIVGLCINTVPLRIRFDWDRSLAAALIRSRDAMADWLENAHGSLPDILAQPRLGGFALNHLVTVENYPMTKAAEFAPGIVIDAVEADMPNSFDFSLTIFPEPALRATFSYDAAAFEPEAVPALATRYARLLRVAAEGMDRIAGAIDLLGDEERSDLVGPNSRGAGLATAPNVAAARRAVMAMAAERPALFHAGRVLTHRDLENRSLWLARDLSAAGIGPGACVALAAPISDRFCVAMLACQRLGAAFVPVDPAASADRIAYILRDSGAALLLIDGTDLMTDAPGTPPRFDLAAWRPGGTPECEPPDPPPGATAYVIYTSGTTGMPKGVRVGQASLLNYVAWLRSTGWFDETTRTILLNPPNFDLGYTALFGALLLGGFVALPTEPDRRDPARAIHMIVEQRVDFLKLAPSYLHALLEHPASGALADAPLRTVLLGGEEQRIDDLRRLAALCPTVRLVNHYGPTETTIGCIAGPLDQDVLAGMVSPQRIGRPVANTRILICDRAARPMPRGAAGEILVGGAALAEGYVDGKADLERFVTIGGERFYRTGDYGMWLDDGGILFLGRRDDQVKVRGYRVSMREVEALLRATGEVVDCAVLPTREPDGAIVLTAYVVLTDPLACDVRHLRERLSGRAPEHLIPDVIMPVSRLPLTENGKIDRAALALARPPPPVARPTTTGTPLEEELREIWRDVLFRENIDLDDDFFALGGHSLKAVRVLSRVRRRLGAELAIRDLFEYRTIRTLARRVEYGPSALSRTLVLRDDGAGSRSLFLLPPTLGTATAYKEMVDLLPGPLIVHGLQCAGFDRDERFPESIETMAADFASRIQSASPCQVYNLAGWSLGARLALETGLALERLGARTRLCLLDWAPRPADAPREEALRFEAMRGLPFWGRVIDELQAGLTPADVQRIEALARHLDGLAGATTCGGGLRADILCLEATGNAVAGEMAGLRALTSGLFRVVRVPGNHYTMFHPENIGPVVQAFGRYLAGAWPSLV